MVYEFGLRDIYYDSKWMSDSYNIVHFGSIAEENLLKSNEKRTLGQTVKSTTTFLKLKFLLKRAGIVQEAKHIVSFYRIARQLIFDVFILIVRFIRVICAIILLPFKLIAVIFRLGD